jgi:hypothetical protein
MLEKSVLSFKGKHDEPRSLRATDREAASDDDDDHYGPALPSSSGGPRQQLDAAASRHQGASVPSLSDLRARDEQFLEDAASARQRQILDIRQDRSEDRKQQKERLDDLLPRAEAGTRERQLEKKREKADSNRVFAAAKDAGGDVDLRDSEVMGDEDSLAELKRMKMEKERKKNERELRREEVLRARQAEREVRMQAHREREEKTMSIFKEIARQRFGAEG